MNLRAFLVAAIASIAAVSAKVDRVNHDEVQPFEQPEPVTESQKSAVKYKPQLKISYGCHPYPAVQADGAASGGLEWSGKRDGDCEGGLGSQVYARSAWYHDHWAIMYSWYFPKGKYHVTSSHRHYWEYAIVWTDSNTAANSSIVGVSMYAGVGHAKENTPPMLKYMDGNSIKLESYKSFWGNKAALRLTKEPGETQPLITWDQLTVAARETLNSDELDGNVWLTDKDEVPFKDDIFTKRLKDAFPF